MEEKMDFKADDCGIILVAADDPISRFTMSITKQEYSSIGFFYATTFSGYLEIMVILIDVFGTNTPSWLQTNDILTMSNTKLYTLHDLLNNDLITKASIKKIRRNELFESRQIRLRSAIADLMSEDYELPLLEAIYQLFGHPISAPANESLMSTKKRRLTAVEMVNMVIYSIGEWDKVPQNGNVSLTRIKDISTTKPMKNDAAGKLSLISMLGAPFIQQEVTNPTIANKLIQSYITNNELFDELIELQLPKRDVLKLELARNEALGTYRNYLIKILTTTLDEMLRNQTFCQTVINGINRNQKLLSQKFTNSDLLAIMSNLGKSSQNLLVIISESLKTGKLNGTQLQQVAKDLNDNLRHAFPKNNIYQVSLSLPKKNGYIKYVKNIIPSQKSDNKDKASAIRNLNYDILQILNAIQQHKIPEINLESLITAANTLNDGSQPLITPLKEEFSVSAIVYNSQKDLDHLIKLENGKEYILPLQGADLNTFSYSELQELTKILDTNDSPSLTSLKRDIMKKLSYMKTDK